MQAVEPEKCGRVFVVDDSEILLEVVSMALIEAGWEVETFDNGEDALRRARDESPCTVVCDLHMPDVNGMEVIRRMRELDRTVPVIVLSGDDNLSAVLGAVHEGAFDYVLKAGEDVRPLLAAVDRAAACHALELENLRLNQALLVANKNLESKLEELAKQHRLLEEEQARSAALLLNVLPSAIADRIMDGEIQIADTFDNVTVMFADIVGFTRFAADKPAELVVRFLNGIFSQFDHLLDDYGLEKIKTIGDAYMAASGLPRPLEDHAARCADMALEMMAHFDSHAKRWGSSVGLRIGINTGPVVAGVIGARKFIYDLWGDTVNVASRMERQGLPGKIQVTQSTYELLRERYDLEPRGALDVRSRGNMDTYLLRGRRQEGAAARAADQDQSPEAEG